MSKLSGKILVASPLLEDPNFFQSVILLIEHNEQGALGLIINRPTQTLLDEAWGQVSDLPCSSSPVIYQGGPCEGPLMAVHVHPHQSEVAIHLDEHEETLHFATAAHHIQWLVQNNQEQIKYFVGYAGWSPGQLEEELAEGSWFLLSTSVQLVFRTPQDFWQQLTRQLLPDINTNIIPTDPSLN